MDQQELDKTYSQSPYAPNTQRIIARWRTNSEIVRQRLGDPLRLAYGDNPVEALDVYRSTRSMAPVHIFIHGGAWQQGQAENYGFPAELFVNAGAHYIVPDVDRVQDAGDSLMPLAAQVRRAVAWVYRNAESFGGHPNRIFVSGHSSDGHLAGVVLTTDWESELGLPNDILKGRLCCSGMFDLRPVRLSARRKYIDFTDEMEHLLSPIRHLNKLHAPLVIAYGTLETPEFQRQSREFAATLEREGKPVELVVADGYNHFEILDTLANPYGHLGRAVLEQMQIDG